MKQVQFNFKGLICPVFTAFTDDKTLSINVTVIDKYAQWLKQKGVNAVLVNSTTGEGMCLRVDERKRLTEEWLKVCRKYQMLCVAQIGGASIADVTDLAEHAEKTGVDACICLADLFFRPKSEEDLVHYIKNVAQHCPTRPVLYYHIPVLTGIRLPMDRFCDLAEKEIPNFCGMLYASGNLAEYTRCIQQGRVLLLGYGTILCGALVQGMESACLTSLNISPETVLEIVENIHNNRLHEAMTAQVKLNKRILEITGRSGDYVSAMKTAFNESNNGIKLGPCRKPTINITTQMH